MQAKLNEIKAKVEMRRAGEREEYCWYYLRRAFPTMGEQGLASLAKHILRHTGL
jgi:hypothetical protein